MQLVTITTRNKITLSQLSLHFSYTKQHSRKLLANNKTIKIQLIILLVLNHYISHEYLAALLYSFMLKLGQKASVPLSSQCFSLCSCTFQFFPSSYGHTLAVGRVQPLSATGRPTLQAPTFSIQSTASPLFCFHFGAERKLLKGSAPHSNP